jgi:hypothetical protein
MKIFFPFAEEYNLELKLDELEYKTVLVDFV